jgi:hypothetical protein
MKSRNVNFVIVLVFLFLSMAGFTGCEMQSTGMKPSTGKTNELLVVTNSNTYWNGTLGQTIKTFFGRELPGMPQSESMFSVAHIPDAGFTQMLQSHHNLFIVDINSSFREPIIETRRDLWASPQRVVKITVPDEATFYQEFEQRKEAIIELFNENERRRATNAFAAIRDNKITGMLNDLLDLDILIPESFTVAVKESDFVWLRREAQQFSQGILIYTFPYTDTMAFNYDEIIAKRNELTAKYVPGPADGSYMIVSMIEPPFAETISFNDNYTVEMRGLWEVSGDFMGGPFINFTLVDEKRSRIITVDGFVYNPGYDKRDLLRQLEALLYTLNLNPEKETQ